MLRFLLSVAVAVVVAIRGWKLPVAAAAVVFVR
jgi:hypothetical protein